jgi:uncharacterized protein (DUF433 family)
MNRTDWRKRVVVDRNIHHGEPCIKGTRVPVALLIGSLAEDMTAEEILRSYPQLELDDVRAALVYARK